MWHIVSQPFAPSSVFFHFIRISQCLQYFGSCWPLRFRAPSTPSNHRLLCEVCAKMDKRFAFNDVALKALPPGEFWDIRVPAFGVWVGKRVTTFFFKKG